MHIAEVVTIAKSLPLLRLNTYKSLILSYSADYRRIFLKKTAYDEEIVREVKKLLQEFTLLWKASAFVVTAEAEAKYDDLDESDVFFKERKFVLDLVRYYYSKEKSGLFVKLAEDYHYPLAQYMIHRPIDNRIDGFAFAKSSFSNQLGFIVDHLFKY